MELLIDDVRDLGTDAIARNSMAARTLLSLKCWTKVYFDHDLGLLSENGHQILRWALLEDLLPNEVCLVTSNPVGLKNMQEELIASGYKQDKTGRSFFLPISNEIHRSKPDRNGSITAETSVFKGHTDYDQRS